ncbi:unnamed protein product [Caenorhabditis angaria]|uniref:Serpentine receptor class gamma n=1 Tax=Caenorhabditis angaria TaxID=860376 RepID=A0A9P1N746_9PELO|nr:unnamed protein product [Caenorhabditis angaria]
MEEDLNLTLSLPETILQHSFFFYHVILMFIYFSSVFIIFPIFIHFTRINREKDRNASIYPITYHLYQITIISQFMIIILASSIIIVILETYFKHTNIISFILLNLAIISSIIVYIFNLIVVPVQNLLIFFLAFQRFLVYFCPKSEKYLVPGEKRFKCIIKWLYSLSIFGNTLYGIKFILQFITSMHEQKLIFGTFWSIINSVVYITLDAFVMFSSIFYLSIFLHYRKITKNSTNYTKSHPEKAIFYQTLVLFCVKLLGVPMMYSAINNIFIFEDVQTSTLLNAIYYPLFITDILTTPIVFQITYIFCNKANLEVLLKMNFRNAKTWRMIFCGAELRKSQVENEYSLRTVSEVFEEA